MSVFAKPEAAAPPKTEASKQIAILYVILLTIMAVAQLFTFEDFIEIVPTFGLPLGAGALPYLTAPLLVVAEVFAIPFLLRMNVSRAFRWLSMVLGWVAAGAWFVISLWVVLTHQATTTIGFLGSVGSLMSGWWAVCLSLGLVVLAAWASWGLWPKPLSFHSAKK